MTLDSHPNHNLMSDSDWNKVLLYVTNDASLDRAAFESQFESDPDLCEKISEAVLLIEKIRQSGSNGQSDKTVLIPPLARPADVSSFYRSWNGIVLLAASIAILTVAASWVLWTQGSLAIRNDARMLVAWADLHCTANCFAELTEDLADVSDIDDDSEFPEWLITATLAEESVTQELVQ